MGFAENMQNTLRFVTWNDYRGSKNSVVVNYESCPTSKLPVRNFLDVEQGAGQFEPNIETGTYGYGRCVDARARNSFVKNRKGYVFFMTGYQGTEEKYKDKHFVTGYYKVTQTADVRKLHMKHFEDDACPDLNFCYALRSSDIKFVSIEDAFELSPEKLQEWGYKGKISKQLKLAFDEQKTGELLDFFGEKQNIADQYIKEIEAAMQKAKSCEGGEEEITGQDNETPTPS